MRTPTGKSWWVRADEALLRYVREQSGGGPAPESDARALAQMARFRRVLAALGLADLAALGVARKA